MYYVFLGLYAFVCFLLLVVVLLQQGKGGDIAAAFGGSSSQAAFGARAGATVLTRATTILGALFMVGALVLSVIGSSGGFGGSVVGGVAPPAETATPTPAVDPLRPGAPIATTPVTATPTGAPTTPATAPTAPPKPTPTVTPPAATPASKGGGS
jgi:preprotein translocase subunit SecG